MWIKKAALLAAVSAAVMTWSWKNSDNDMNLWIDWKGDVPVLVDETGAVDTQKKEIKNQIFVCLDTDTQDSYTHKNILESISTPEETILEYPISQLFQKYGTGKRPHPLYVSGVSKTFRSLVWRNWIEEISSNINQNLQSRKTSVTSSTAYQVWDTLRFALIDNRLEWNFPESLSTQLNEDWFKSFSDPDSLDIISKDNIWDSLSGMDGYIQQPAENKDFVYDIVVKRLPSWKSGLALYRDGKLFMATYVSVWTNSAKTRMWQFKIESAEAYRRSRKYDNSAMPFGLNYSWSYFFHQWDVSWMPLSHGCVRLPWVYASVLFSLVKNQKNVDVFIDKNLYNSNK